MALLYISESPGLLEDSNGRPIPVFSEPPTTTQRVSFTTAASSSAFRGNTRVVRIYSDTACNIVFSAAGGSPTATATDPRYAAATEYFRHVEPNAKLSVYDGSS